VYPHGIASNRTFDTFLVTAQYGNCVYKLSASQLLYKKISLDNNPAVAASSSDATTPDPHEILMIPDYSRYFVTCSSSHQVKVLSSANDSVLATIPVGRNPQEMAISKTRPYLFVTCTEDVSSNAGMKGSVYAINYNTLETTRIDGDFYQPHAIAVDDQNGTVYVVSSNASPTGPLPHHGTPAKGRAGWYSVLDLNTFQPVSRFRYQVQELPYSAATRFR
jgi:YVTN family beta-propeller protein